MTPSEEVLKYYPYAKAVNCLQGTNKYYRIETTDQILGRGKTRKAAWKAASSNINN